MSDSTTRTPKGETVPKNSNAPGSQDKPSPAQNPESLFLSTVKTIRPTLILGLGLYWVWLHAMFYAAFPSFVLSNPLYESVPYQFGMVFLVAFIAAVFGMGALNDRITFFIRRRRFQMTVAVVLSVSTGCLLMLGGVLSLPIVFIAEGLCGLAAGFLLLLCGEAYRRPEPRAIVLNSALSVLCAFLVYRCIVFFPPLILLDIASIIFTLIPLGVVVFLQLALYGGWKITQPQQFIVTREGTRVATPGLMETLTFHRTDIKQGRLFVRIGLPFVFFGVVLKVLCDEVFRQSVEADFLSNGGGEFLAQTLLPCLVLFALAALFIATRQSGDYEQLFRYGIPLVGICVLVTCLPGISGVASSAFASAGFLCLETMLWVGLCVLSHNYRISSLLVMGSGRGALALGMLATTVAVAMSVGSETLLEAGLIQTILLVMLVCGSSLLPRGRDIEAVTAVGNGGTTQQRGSEQKERTAQQGEQQTGNEKRFIVRCERIAHMYLLSPREAEVFILLAKGRNTAYISKNLFISEGTVHTHMLHIYKKLNIHRQQELIDMVDAFNGATTQSLP
jgi:DNA-binding CsgD family transcriptional regulator